MSPATPQAGCDTHAERVGGSDSACKITKLFSFAQSFAVKTSNCSILRQKNSCAENNTYDVRLKFVLKEIDLDYLEEIGIYFNRDSMDIWCKVNKICGWMQI